MTEVSKCEFCSGKMVFSLPVRGEGSYCGGMGADGSILDESGHV